MKNIEYAIAEAQYGISISIAESHDEIPKRRILVTIRFIDNHGILEVRSNALDEEELENLIKYLQEAQQHVYEFNQKKISEHRNQKPRPTQPELHGGAKERARNASDYERP